jgi:para-nitrobenzyl esterase
LTQGNRCVQPSVTQPGKVHGSEDCLYLNIWAPLVAAELVPQGDDQHPVMVWIHGGGNSIGSTNFSLYNGSLMASEHDVIVVTINYRLGPMGWLRHPALQDEESTFEDRSGNYGTLDIIAALGWVNRNISNFGGDPNNVTIYGESAGGINVLSMMASPLATGLFHRAIVQSGGWFPSTPERAERFADEGGHQFSGTELTSRLLVDTGVVHTEAEARSLQANDEQISHFLRSIPVEDIFAPMLGNELVMLDMPMLFTDGYVLPDASDIEFLDDPESYNAVPLIIGSNRDETKLFMYLSNERVKKLLGLIPYKVVDEIAYERDARYGSDVWKARGVDEIARAIHAGGGQPVYAYRFDADDLRDIGLVDLSQLLGAHHAADLPYVFGTWSEYLDFFHPQSMRDERDFLSESMMSYWAEFAYTGNPGMGKLGEQVTWPAWSNDPDVDRLLVLDHESDQGIFASSESITLEELKSAMRADTSFGTDEEFCRAWREVFWEPSEDERCR